MSTHQPTIKLHGTDYTEARLRSIIADPEHYGESFIAECVDALDSLLANS